jgi:hypothetical protein
MLRSERRLRPQSPKNDAVSAAYGRLHEVARDGWKGGQYGSHYIDNPNSGRVPPQRFDEAATILRQLRRLLAIVIRPSNCRFH